MEPKLGAAVRKAAKRDAEARLLARAALTIDDGDHVLTSDRDDLDRLLDVRRVAATIIDV